MPVQYYRREKVGIVKVGQVCNNFWQLACNLPTWLIPIKETFVFSKARIEVGCDKPIDMSILEKHISSVIGDILPVISENAVAFHII